MFVGKCQLSFFVLFLAMGYLSPLAYSDESKATLASLTQTILLEDGTVIKGHLIGIVEDYYLIDTQHLGQIKVPIQNVKNIAKDNTDSFPFLPKAISSHQTNSSDPSMDFSYPQIPSLQPITQWQQYLLFDPEISTSLKDLLNDEEIMKLLNNEDLMKAFLSIDPTQIQNNPNVQVLMKHPKMQEIMQKISQKMNSAGKRETQDSKQ